MICSSGGHGPDSFFTSTWQLSFGIPIYKGQLRVQYFVAMKTGLEAARVLRYKLLMMRVSIEKPIYIYGNNMLDVYNTQRPDSVLKKLYSICSHFIRESSAMGKVVTSHIRLEEKSINICTKIMSGGEMRDHKELELDAERNQAVVTHPVGGFRRYRKVLSVSFTTLRRDGRILTWPPRICDMTQHVDTM